MPNKLTTLFSCYGVKMSAGLIIAGAILINIGIFIGCASYIQKRKQEEPVKHGERIVKKEKVLEPKQEAKAFLSEYEIAKKLYPWLTSSIWKSVTTHSKNNGLYYPIVLSIIQSESEGKPWAKGPWVEIETKKGVIESRAIGLMQVMPEYWYNGPKKDLEQPDLNIKLGSKIFGIAMKKRKRNLVVALKDYNSGPGSTYYNRPYIRKTMKRYYAHLKQIASNNVAWSYDDYQAKYGSL